MSNLVCVEWMFLLLSLFFLTLVKWVTICEKKIIAQKIFPSFALKFFHIISWNKYSCVQEIPKYS